MILIGQLLHTVGQLVAEEKYVVSEHASEQLAERGIMEWPAVAGLDDGGLIAGARSLFLRIISLYPLGGTKMSSTMKELGIDQMTPAQRVALALDIWDSLGDDRPGGQLSADQRAELARRDDEMEANPEIGLTWEQVRAKVEGQE